MGETEEIRVVEYHHMNKERYFPATFTSTICIRGLIYPTMLIKTRLQIQSCNSVYSGTFDAFKKIAKAEGMSGLYRGFLVSSLQVFPAAIYLTSYEGTRHYMSHHWGVENRDAKLFVGGFVGSFVCQLTLVPLELIMQHMMLMGNTAAQQTTNSNSSTRGTIVTSAPSTSTTTTNTTTTTTTRSNSTTSKVHRRHHNPHSLARFHMSPSDHKKLMGPLRAVMRGMYKDLGIRGFYQGFWAAIFCHGPYNALFWVFYDHYAEWFTRLLPDGTPRLAIIALAAPLGGMTSSYITNPLDVIRARIQVDGTNLKESMSILWKEEGLRFLSKGISARVVFLGTHAFFTFVSYEVVKRWSVLEQYKPCIRW